MQAITLDLTDAQLRKLHARARRAELPLEQYLVAAASDPLKFAWQDDVQRERVLRRGGTTGSYD